MDTIEEQDKSYSLDISSMLQTLFRISERTQNRMGKEFRHDMSSLSHDKEFSTIRLQTSRRAGHSYGEEQR